MSSEINKWRSEIQAHALEDPPFKLLPEADLKTESARFYWYPRKESPVALVKVFTGGTAGILYRQEITALYGLRATGRVCRVLCDSTRHHPNFWEGDFSGPYFIAKVYYPKSLASVLRDTTGLERLELAAQEIDIAHLFLKLGWRDYDWRKENDVIDDGKLLRVDLDSASSLSAMFEEKSTVGDPRYFSSAECDTLQEFLLLREKILRLSEPNEVRNLAIRLSHTVFIDDNDESRLTTLIGKLQSSGGYAVQAENTSDSTDIRGSNGSAGKGNKAAAVRGKLGGYVGRAGDLLTHGVATVLKSRGADGRDPQTHRDVQTGRREDSPPTDSGDAILLLDEWVDLWLGQAPPKTTQVTPQTLSQLSHDEWGLLARLFHHLIRNEDHGFTLADFHMSMLMLIVAFLRDRRQRIAAISRSEEELIKAFAPNTGFFEMRQVFAIPAAGTVQRQSEADRSPRPKRPQPTPVKSSELKVAFSSGSGHWAAPTKGLGREGEDRTFVHSGKHLLVAAVTDGVSEASGLEAAMVVEKELREWCEQLSAASPEEAAGEIRDILRKINASLIRSYKETKQPHQAMLVIAVVGKKGDSCFASIGQAGDSDCVVFSPDGSPRFSTKSWTTTRLGTSETLRDEDVRVEHISLAVADASGSYRIRLFSDGIGERGYERVRDVVGIADLISEAAHWPESLGSAVGHDDWSIAGLDISIVEVPAYAGAPLPDHVETARERTDETLPEQTLLSDIVNRLDATKFSLSERAKEFWREAIPAAGGTSEVARFSFIRSVVGNPRTTTVPSPTKPTTDSRVVTHGGTVKETWFSEWKSAIIALGVVALLCLVVVVIMWAMRSTSPTSDEARSEETVERPAPSPAENTASDPELETPGQKKIYFDLKEKRVHVSDGLPGGEGVTNQTIKLLLNDLAQVLIRSKFRVSIEVFSAPGGDPLTNIGMSDRRAKLIRRTLITDYKVPDTLVLDAVGRGLWNTSSVNLSPETAQQVNTTGAVFIIRRR
jgi:hypothetical protein